MAVATEKIKQEVVMEWEGDRVVITAGGVLEGLTHVTAEQFCRAEKPK